MEGGLLMQDQTKESDSEAVVEDKEKSLHEQPQEKEGEPSPQETLEENAPVTPPPSPTRYGDWERKGRCVDF